MSRIIVEVSGEQHKVIKALAAVEGKSIKDYVLERILPNSDIEQQEPAWNELKAVLEDRIDQAKQNGTSTKSVAEIAEETLQKLGKT